MNNSSSNLDTTFSSILISFMILQQLIFVIAFIGNSLVIWIFFTRLKLKSTTNRFIVSLALADVLSGIVTGVQIFYFVYPGMNDNMVTCFLRYLSINYTTQVSQMTVMFTTFDRYVAICHPHHYVSVMTRKVAIILSLLPWVLSFVSVSSPLLGWHIWERGCKCEYLLIFERGYYLTSSVISYSFSILTFIMYIFILKTAWRYYSRVKPVGGDTSCNHGTNKSKTMERDVRNAKVTGVVTLAFSVCWLPFMTFPFQKGIGIDQISDTGLTVMNWLVFLGMLNSIVNPFIYAWKRRDFSKECKRTFGCFKNQEDMSQTSVEF
ncbi:adenosine receptor A2b-like [Mytilus californianus]|uniref:adenosine receptor A2b-like n=1 Tax=Mytilus californianus TaxID=6549 RepID=UPI002245D09E|nr:adenosine receptor A2b-like [Mytilus californianus]